VSLLQLLDASKSFPTSARFLTTRNWSAHSFTPGIGCPIDLSCFATVAAHSAPFLACLYLIQHSSAIPESLLLFPLVRMACDSSTWTR